MRKIAILCLIILFLSTQTFFQDELSAMGGLMAKPEDLDKDEGIIGERKTIRGTKSYHDSTLDATYTHRTKGATFVTPILVEDVAHFNVEWEYQFDFACLKWKYEIQSGYLNFEEYENIGWIVRLESPDKKTLINIKKYNLAAKNSLATSITEEQRSKILTKALPDPFIDEERILAGQQAIKWVLRNDLEGYNLANKENAIKFTSEIVGGKKFVKADVELFDGSNRKKCTIWALNYWGYREMKTGERRMLIWIAKIISDPDEFLNVSTRSRMIFETLQFARNQTVYSDLGHSE